MTRHPGLDADPNYDRSYIDKAKEFVKENGIKEMYVQKEGAGFAFYIYPHKDGYIAAHPVLPPKYTTPCYPPEHMIKMWKEKE